MDRIVEQVTAYADSLKYEALPAEVVHQVKRVTVDALGCGLGGFPSDTARIAREVASAVRVDAGGATLLGTGQKTTADLAAFANGTAVRYLDFNDTYVSVDVCHPSDHVAPVLAAAEAAGADGRRAIVGIALAYEVHCRLCNAANARARGWDQGTYGALASAVAAAKVSALSQGQIANALCLAAAANVSLAETRYGTVSMWKGAAMPDACRNGVFAALLAQRGMTGPPRVFEGRAGFFQAVTGPFQLEPFGGPGVPYRVMESRIKPFPSGYHSQAAIEAALQVRHKLGHLGSVQEVVLETYRDAADIMAGDPEKWHPTTRETADHSLSYLVAVALTYGAVEEEHFQSRYLSDQALLGLTQRVKVVTTEECNRSAPQGNLSILRVVTADGLRHTARVPYPRGHPRNPMSDGELEEKFRRLAQGVLKPQQTQAALERLWCLEEVGDVGDLLALLRVG